MEALYRDFRFALRRLARRPGFTLMAILPLAIGLGASAVLLSFAEATLLRPLAAEKSEEMRRLVLVGEDGSSRARFSWSDYADLAERPEPFAELLAVSLVPVSFATAQSPRDPAVGEQVFVEAVSGNFFHGLGIGAPTGRVFSHDEDGDRVTVLAHRFWQRRFAEDPAVLGRTVELNGDAFTVIGVADEALSGTFAGAEIAAWTPIGASADWFGDGWRHDRSRARFHLLGRLAAGLDDGAAAPRLDAVAQSWAERFPTIFDGHRIELREATLLSGQLRRGTQIFLTATAVMIALILLLATANVAHLFLARALDRDRETALQVALGASRFALGRGFAAEGILVTLAGGMGGLFLTFWAADFLRAWRPVDFVPLRLEIMPDPSVFIVTFLLALGVGLILGWVPLRQASQRNLTGALGGGNAKGAAGSRLRRFMLVAQIAFSLALLVAALLFLESLRQSSAMDPGFVTGRVLALDLDLEVAGLGEEESRRFYREIVQRLETRPEVTAVSLADLAPLDLATARRAISLDGAVSDEPAKPRISSSVVMPGYFELLGIAVRAGRVFEAADRRAMADESSAVINQTMAKRLWPGGEALGERFYLVEEGRPVRVVGVVEDVLYRAFAEEPTPHFYLLGDQFHLPAMTLLIQTKAAPMAFLGAAQRELARLDPRVRGFFSRTLKEHLAFALLPARVAAVLFGLFGLTALILATVGIYGAVSHAVARRRRELGVRAALGARVDDLVRLVLGESLRLAAWGLVAGLALALALGRLLGGLLIEVSAADPRILALAASVVLLAALAASWPGAWRAGQADPQAVLREE